MVVHGEAYLTPELLGRLMETAIVVDMGMLVVHLTRATPFPVEQATTIEQRRIVLEAAARYRRQEALRQATPYVPVSGIGILDWDLSTNDLDPRRGTFLSARAGAALWGGAFSASGLFRTGSTLPTDVSNELFAYHRDFPRSSLLQQLTVGDLVTDGVEARSIRGFSISNLPEQRGTEGGQAIVSPQLPAGWNYEVMQAGRLVGSSEGSGGGAVPIDLQPGGITPIYVRMYGPAGQDITRELIYHAPVSLLPPDRLEYALGGGSCLDGSCDLFRYADIRYGLTRSLTLGGGAEWTDDSLRSSLRPSLEASFTTGRSLTGELSSVPGQLLRGVISAHDADQTTAMVSGELARPAIGALLPFLGAGQQWTLSQSLDRRLTGMKPLGAQSLRLESSFAGNTDTGVRQWSAGATAALSGGLWQLQYENGQLSPGLVSLRATVLLPVRSLPRLGALGNLLIAQNADGLQILESGLTLRPKMNATITVDGRWTRQERRPTLSLGFNAVLGGGVQTTARITSSRYASTSAILELGGATAIDPSGQIALSPLGRVGYAGIYGTVYRDLDGNGRLDPEDQPVAGAGVLVGDTRVVTDSAGRFHAWSLRPFDVASVAIDSATSADPYWTAQGPPRQLRPVPNTAMRVDLALVQTRELSGALIPAPDVVTAAGLTILIRNVLSGDTLSTVTFSDGEFYVPRIRPGRYTLHVAPSSLRALDATASPDSLDFTVPATGGDVLLELPRIALKVLRPEATSDRMPDRPAKP